MGIKSKIRQYISDKLGVTENKILIKSLNSYITLIGGDVITLPEVIEKEVIHDIKERYKIDSFNTKIHRNDMMLYNHIIHYEGDTSRAVSSYFEVGIDAAQRIYAEVNNNDIESILDFGSGYGRVSRFLPFYFNNSKIEVSEVKSTAMKFQKEQFGFLTKIHSENPESLTISKKSLIIAVSVFTHLPLRSCKEWINSLIDFLQPGGVLIYTFNDISKCPFPNDGAFHFEQQSEDSSMSGIPDRLDDVSQYGSTYFSKQYMKSLLDHQKGDFEIKDSFIGNHSAVIFKK